MKFEDVANIWDLNLSVLPRPVRGMVYYERIKQVVCEIRDDPEKRQRFISGGRVSRVYLLERAGCKRSTLTQNHRVRAFLSNVEAELGSESQQAELPDDEVVVPRMLFIARCEKSERSSLGYLHSVGTIVATNSLCRIRGKAMPGIPTLLWPEGVDESASDWFRYLVDDEGASPSSVDMYANVIRSFGAFRRRRRVLWTSVDDSLLKDWKSDLATRGIGPQRINTCLRTVFRFYQWAELKKRLKYHVGIYDPKDLPVELEGTIFPISAIKIYTKKGTRRASSWTTPLTVRVRSQSEGKRNTPTEDQIRVLHHAAMSQEHGERNSLMLSWAEEVGARRAEFLQVKVSDLPSLDQLSDLIERDEPWTVDVVRKGGRNAKILVPTDLILRTWDYVEGSRSEIVRKFKSQTKAYREPDEIFLSSKTGQVLHPDSVTSIGRRLFRCADIRNANVHRLRARYAVRVVETLLDAVFDGQVDIGVGSTWVETILLMASERMGHMSPMSLRPYLNFILQRRINTSDASLVEDRKTKLRQLHLMELTAVKRLAHHSSLADAAQLVSSGNFGGAARSLRMLADQLDLQD